ncbi:MAG: hypothetical protein KDK99_00865 [Verrucomicrobiales bacterium]|nr:hypothetical protein [Verrucomicrobiales bacterium]
MNIRTLRLSLALCLPIFASAADPAAAPEGHAGHTGHTGALLGLKQEMIAHLTEADFLKLGAEPNTVAITLVATLTDANHGMNFNGYSHGKAVYKVPVGWKVKVHFINPSPVPHSAIVVESYDVKKLQVQEPYFEGGAVEKHLQGIAYGSADFTFTPDEEGDFALACGFPSHALAGHWVTFQVVPADQRPSLKLGEDGEEKVLK